MTAVSATIVGRVALRVELTDSVTFDGRPGSSPHEPSPNAKSQAPTPAPNHEESTARPRRPATGTSLSRRDVPVSWIQLPDVLRQPPESNEVIPRHIDIAGGNVLYRSRRNIHTLILPRHHDNGRLEVILDALDRRLHITLDLSPEATRLVTRSNGLVAALLCPTPWRDESSGNADVALVPRAQRALLSGLAETSGRTLSGLRLLVASPAERLKL